MQAIADFRDFSDILEPFKIALFFDYCEKSTKFYSLETVITQFKGTEFTIPSHFVSDGMSIPRGLWNYCMPLDARYCPIFYCHDWYYSTGQLTRADADLFMLEGLKAAGMPLMKRQTIYRAVRLFGASHYDVKKLGVKI